MVPSKPKKPFRIRMAEKLAASRFFTFSALIHMVILFLAGGVVLFKHYAELPDFTASEGGLVSDEGREEAAPERPPEATQRTFQPTEPQFDPPTLSVISAKNLSVPTFHVSEVAPSVKAPLPDMVKVGLAAMPQGAARGMAGYLPATMAARAGGAARNQAMLMNGGKKESEEAVLRGLRWLVETQKSDGSWGGGNRPAMTGLSLLSFFGHGETPLSPEFGPAIQKALVWMTENGTKFEGRLSMQMEFDSPGVYAHAISTYALGEYYTLTKDERVVDLLTRAVGYIVDGQAPDGSWAYGYKKSRPGVDSPFHGDTSISGWQIQALKAAHLSGLNIPGVDQALDRAMVDLERVQCPGGGFGYKGRNDNRFSLTGVGVLCTYLWKQKKDKVVMDGIDYLMAGTEKEYPVLYQGEKADLYAWYYDTQACLMVGGDAWTKWNGMFQTEITNAQAPDGSWPPMKSRPVAVGVYQTQPGGSGALYRTNLCILMLEVYYRYLPSTR
jgi:hypothetical protein